MNGVPTEETDTFESLRRVIRYMDDNFMGKAYHPHLSAHSIEEIWTARGVALVMDSLRDLYQLTYGEPYVPGSFRLIRNEGESDAS